MNNDFTLPRSILIGLVCVCVSLVLGYLLATPTSFVSLLGVGMLVAVVCAPLALRWHHALLIVTWNASIVVFLLPGQPPFWTVAAVGSLALSLVGRTLRHESTFLHVRSVAWPLLLLLLVVTITVIFTGGIGGRALGNESWGAKRYLGVFGAVLGYFALVAKPIPLARARWWSGVFILSGVTAVMSDLAFAAGPSFYFLFSIFPSEIAFHQATTQDTVQRSTGVAWAAAAGYWFMLLNYGIRGILDLRRPWRGLLFAGLFALGLLGGFRSSIILFFILFAAQFYFEGLFRSRLFPALLLSGLLAGWLVVGFVEHMPMAVQRSLSFLPIEVHPMARQDAAGSLDWRLEMWRVVLPDVPKYLVLGKGYSFSGTDYNLMQEAIRRGFFTAYEDTLISGNYHNGILTLLIPFGVFGFLAFLWFCWSSWRVLRTNYLHGAPELKLMNTFFLSLFVARLFFYFVFYGQFDIDLMVFTGLVGMSIALNNGVSIPRIADPNKSLVV